MQIINANTAAINVYRDYRLVCVPADRDTVDVRTFSANSCDLLKIDA